MPTVSLNFEDAFARHGKQAQKIADGLEAPAEAIEWSYDWGVRIDGRGAPDIHKGIDVFKQAPERYIINLKGWMGRRHRGERLDSQELVANPAQWPLEMFSVPRPEGQSIWVWQPRRAASPGWNEAVVVSSLEHPKNKTVEIQAVTDDGATHIFSRTKSGLWDAATSSTATGKWNKVPSDDIVAGLDDGCMVAKQESVADLLRQLGADPSFMAVIPAGADPSMGDDEADQAPEPGTGRRWGWGQSISIQEMGPYVALLGSKQGPSSGNFLEVIGALANPVNHIKQSIAEAVLLGVARGQDAMEAARQAIDANEHLPSLPEGTQDIVAFIEANAQGMAPAGIRPVMLGRR